MLLAAFFQRVEVDIAIEVLADFAQGVECIPHRFFLCKISLRPFRGALHDLKGRPVAERGGELVHRALEDFLRFPFIHLERAHLVNHIVHHVAHVQGIEHAQAEVDREFESGFAGSRLQAVAIVEQKHAEAVKARILQRKAVFGFVHAEPARAAGARGKEHVIIENFLARLARSFEGLQVLHEVADGEVGRIALAVVAILFPELETGDIGHRHAFTVVTRAEKYGADQLFVLPGKPPKRIVTRLRSSAVNARSIGLWKCFGGSKPASFRKPQPFRGQDARQSRDPAQSVPVLWPSILPQ